MQPENNNSLSLPCPAMQILMHRPPMLLIDRLLTHNHNSATASANFGTDNICFLPERGVSGEYFIEIMAQTMAAAHNYHSLINNQPLKDGYIAGIETFTLHTVPDAPAKVKITVETIMDLGSMKLMLGKVYHDDELIAESQLKVWVGE